MKWTKGQYARQHARQHATGPVATSGHIYGPFGVEHWGCWWITHIPTGKCCRYSEWPTLRQAKAFVEALVAAGDWDRQRVSIPRLTAVGAAERKLEAVA